VWRIQIDPTGNFSFSLGLPPISFKSNVIEPMYRQSRSLYQNIEYSFTPAKAAFFHPSQISSFPCKADPLFAFFPLSLSLH
jgi:hypothetical protein